MSSRRRPPIVAGALALMAVLVAPASGQPIPPLNPYVLFAQDSLHARSATIVDGDVGVNDGFLYFTGTNDAPKSDFRADTTHLGLHTDCEDLFTNTVVGGSGVCPKQPGAVPRPIIPDLAAACGFPSPLPKCDPTNPVVVGHDEVRSLPPDVAYGDLIVEGGGAGPAVLQLSGNYVFCNVRVSRNGSVVFTGPSTVKIDGSSRVSNSTYVGPGNGASAPPPGDIKWLVQGSQARFSRKGTIALYACAPAAKMIIGSGNTLTGRFVARSLRVKKSTIKFAPPVPGVCGDTVISPGEQCETTADCPAGTCVACQCQTATTTTTTTLPGCDDDDDCNPGSPGGGFVCENGHCVPPCDDDDDCNVDSPGGGFVCDENGHCVPPCDDDMDCNQGSAGGGFVCEDGHCVPGSSTTTTTTTSPSSSTHSTTSTPTTSTTLHPCASDQDCPIGVCRDGVCVPECESDEDCNVDSPGGSFVCRDGRCVPGGEICGDCIDNDGDGLVDFEDTDCCDAQAGQLFAMELRKGRVRPRKTTGALLRLKGGLARSGLASMIDPPTNAVMLQIRSTESGEVLCAAIPAGKFVKAKKRTFRYSRKKAPLPVELGRNLDRIVIKVLKSGEVRYRVKGKRAMLETPAEGTLRITFGFSTPGADASENVCSQAVRVFRGSKKGQLRYP